MYDIEKIAKQLAAHDPREALAFLEGKKIPQDFKAQILFTTTGKEHPIQVDVLKEQRCDVVIYDMIYTVRRPNYLKDDPAAKIPLDKDLQLVPYVDVRLEFIDCNTTVLSDTFQPLETVARPIQGNQSNCCQPFYVGRDGWFRLYAQMTRDLFAGDPNENNSEIPYIVDVVLKGMKLPARILVSYLSDYADAEHAVTTIIDRHNIWLPKSCPHT